MLFRSRGLQMAGRRAFGPSVLTVNRELVRRVRGQGRLVVHSSMERDVGLLRLYPGIPASLVGTPAQPPRCLPPVPPPLPTFVSLGPAPPPLPSQPVHLICELGLSPRTSQRRVPRAPLRLMECGPGLCFLVAALVVPAVHPLATSCPWGGHGACLRPAQ